MVESFDKRAAALDLDELDDVATAAGLVIEPQAFFWAGDGERKRALGSPSHFLSLRQPAVMFAAKLHDDLGRDFAQCGSPGVIEAMSERRGHDHTPAAMPGA